MDEAELAQVLGEAFRQYSSELKQGTRVPKDFLPLLEGKQATITLLLNANHQIELVTPQEATMPQPDLPMVESQEEKPRPRKKTA